MDEHNLYSSSGNVQLLLLLLLLLLFGAVCLLIMISTMVPNTRPQDNIPLKLKLWAVVGSCLPCAFPCVSTLQQGGLGFFLESANTKVVASMSLM